MTILLNFEEAINPTIEKPAKKRKTNWWPSIPGLLSNKTPISGPIKISGVQPITDIIPTAVPVNA